MTSALLFFPLGSFACRPSSFLSVFVIVSLSISFENLDLPRSLKQTQTVETGENLEPAGLSWAYDMQSLSATNSVEISSPFGSQHAANADATVH
jgi:hypothetical protein